MKVSDLDLHCLLKRLQNVSAEYFCDMRLRVNTCEVSVFHEMHARLRGPKSLLTLPKDLGQFPIQSAQILTAFRLG